VRELSPIQRQFRKAVRHRLESELRNFQAEMEELPIQVQQAGLVVVALPDHWALVVPEVLILILLIPVEVEVVTEAAQRERVIPTPELVELAVIIKAVREAELVAQLEIPVLREPMAEVVAELVVILVVAQEVPERNGMAHTVPVEVAEVTDIILLLNRAWERSMVEVVEDQVVIREQVPLVRRERRVL
jgi:hypothetical protein